MSFRDCGVNRSMTHLCIDVRKWPVVRESSRTAQKSHPSRRPQIAGCLSTGSVFASGESRRHDEK
jgi:hypothetical protein